MQRDIACSGESGLESADQLVFLESRASLRYMAAADCLVTKATGIFA